MTEVSARITRSINWRIASGSFWSVVGAGSGRIMNLVAMILAARLLGAEGFGGFALVHSTLGLFGMFAGAALGATATRFIAATYRSSPERAGRIFGLVTGSAFISAMFFGATIVALAPWLSRIVLGSPDLTTTTALGAFLVGMGVLRGVQDASLAGFEAFREIAVLRFIEGVAALVLLPPLVAVFGPPGGIAALGSGLAVAFLPGLYIERRQLKDHGIVIRWREAIAEWRLLRDFSGPSLLANTVATPVLWLCALLLSKTPNGLAELGVYNGAYQWHGPLVFVPMVITSVSLPILAQAWEEGDHESFRRLFCKIFVLGSLLALAPALLAAAMSAQIMAIYGEEFGSGNAVLMLLLLAAPLHVASKIATCAIQSMNRSWYLPIANGAWGATLISLSLLTIGKLGADGLAFAFITSYFVLAVLTVGTVIRLSRV
ncbi:oligosaccharide flippase family protein [Cereibacter sphaeroides]|uniref:oligosaccharide flippase family protein n=1 Tax=Cereibacter sphaeroides TaxID=1063 RepID=UPI003FCDB760